MWRLRALLPCSSIWRMVGDTARDYEPMALSSKKALWFIISLASRGLARWAWFGFPSEAPASMSCFDLLGFCRLGSKSRLKCSRRLPGRVDFTPETKCCVQCVPSTSCSLSDSACRIQQTFPCQLSECAWSEGRRSPDPTWCRRAECDTALRGSGEDTGTWRRTAAHQCVSLPRAWWHQPHHLCVTPVMPGAGPARSWPFLSVPPCYCWGCASLGLGSETSALQTRITGENSTYGNGGRAAPASWGLPREAVLMRRLQGSATLVRG